MKATKNNIIVEVDYSQNKKMMLVGKTLLAQRQYNVNYRERNPVVCKIIQGLGPFKKGMHLVCNYSHFEEDSFWRLYDNVFSIPINNSIIGRLDANGDLSPVCGNVFVSRILKEHKIALPSDLEKPQINHGFIVSGEGWKKGTEIFWYNYSDYQIVYSWQNVEKRYVKVENQEIVGFIKK